MIGQRNGMKALLMQLLLLANLLLDLFANALCNKIGNHHDIGFLPAVGL